MEKDGHHHHSHSHSHGLNSNALDSLGSSIFVYDPLSNATLAVIAITAITQLLIALSPPLSGSVLAFLVAFAEGGMLATIFVHMLPELEFTRTSGLVLIGGFLAFVVLDKVFKILSDDGTEKGSHSHSHSHSHTHSHTQANTAVDASKSGSAQSKSDPAGLRQRKANTTLDTSLPEEPPSSEGSDDVEPVNISPWLNVIADSLHNVTDGLSLAISFRNGPKSGFAAFLVMCCHEIPHQFGDFALLINTGTSKSIARKAQLVTALGTLVGCVLGSWFGALSVVFEELVTPLTAGVFLYVATVGVLPEILETEASFTKMKNARLGLVQLFGVVSGIGLLVLLD